MLKTEMVKIGDKELVKHYSDAGMYIHKLKTNEEYAEAYDVIGSGFFYEETNKPIEEETEVQANE